ncbi:set and mynd domain protein [Grosmannia clavigera kw1407]|uniref:Set and mynd domain protein n=1 Tax=Grosmannia clavigera (strain kw1407 / UAMH 11150) TaxID=655863 RepID=F0XRP0_GROCL|nr:set and mynd domain protein [Grosmannia clavigera kw1407]EFW99604.1 set and mynd domain protein [Grosmannia clavigera kw1407]
MAAPLSGIEIRGDRLKDEDEGTALESAGRRDGRGRGFFATRDFAPGAVVAEFSEPLVVVPFGVAAAQTCNHCLDPRRPAKACTGCRAVAYCGSRCQRAHWTAVHKLECRVLKKALEMSREAEEEKEKEEQKKGDESDSTALTRTTPSTLRIVPAPVRALLQILLQWPAVKDTVAGLEGNVAGFRARPDLWKDFEVQASAACALAGWPATDASLAIAVEAMCKIHTNSFDRSDVDVAYTGTFLDAHLAMANHSCVPNAVVSFAGRKAFLRAEQAIRAGDEVTISYIDYTKPKSVRQRGLDLYHFTCDCARCADDLDVYQVCRASPLVALNAFSFVPNVAVLRNPPLDRKGLPVTSAQIDQIYDDCRPEQPVPPSGRLASLRRAWALCRPLVRARRWAVEPLAHVFQQAIVYYSEQHNFAHALAVECFVALRSDPYKYVAPFAQWRLKGLLLIAKTITNTAIDPTPSSSPSALQAALAPLADGALYEAILLMVLRYGPMGHSDEWELLDTAREMLQDVRSVPDRDLISAALHHWIQDPTEPAAARFFRDNILPPVERLADLAVDILKADLEPQSIEAA